MKLLDQLYCYPWQGRGNNCNTYLYKGSTTMLIDPGHIYTEARENGLETLTKNLAADGVGLEDIQLILCTHGHPDHLEAAGIVREVSGARLAIHQQDEFILDFLEKRYAAATGKEMPTLKPDFYLQAGDLLQSAPDSCSEGEVQVLHTPGHSPGSVCLHLPLLKTLITGDTIFENSIGRTDLPGGDMETMEQSVEKLAALEEVEYLLPGHMGIITGREKVAINFQRIQTYFFA